jgi:DNA-binding MarR family transcriptional regulator
MSDPVNDNFAEGPPVQAWLDAGKKHAPHLSPAELAALLAVASHDGPTETRVAQTLDVEPGAAARLLDILAEPPVGGPLVERITDDEAAERLYLTDEGLDLADRLAASAGLPG